MVIISTFDGALALIQAHGYLLLFFLLIIEGPIVTPAASFAASSGYFNIWIIFILSLLGDIVGDAIPYALGYYGRKKTIDKYDKFFGIKKETLDNIGEHYKNHLGKTITLVKLTPLAIPGLMMAGATKVPVKDYAKWCLIIILPKTIFLTVLGYFFGVLANSILISYKEWEYYLLALIIVVGIIYYLSRKITNFILNRNIYKLKN